MEKRDLKADLELCNKATSGPWISLIQGIKGHIFNDKYVEVATSNMDSLKFIAEAREGWPHAIERALRAEKTLESLKLNLQFIDEYAPHPRYTEFNRALAHARIKIEEVLGDDALRVR